MERPVSNVRMGKKKENKAKNILYIKERLPEDTYL